jgi:MoaA/NifB/PqqE/SkfB family radical SAM enzyme
VWLLHITGGEPSVYPDFDGLCVALTRRHYISVNSNMTNPVWRHFARRVNPARVSFINAGLHLEERERRSGNTPYLEHVAMLRDRGFQVFCSLVGSPSALARFEETVELLGSIGMFAVPKVMRGIFEGKRYPDAYSDLDKERFRKYAEMARKFYAPTLAMRSERPTLDMFRDDDIIDGEPSYKGLLCEAGHLFVRIDPKGELFRCGTSDSIGNIREGTFVRSGSPSPCDTSYCFYFCQKYTSSVPERFASIALSAG